MFIYTIKWSSDFNQNTSFGSSAIHVILTENNEMAQFLLRFITKTLSMYFDRIQIAGVNTAKMKRSLQIM